MNKTHFNCYYPLQTGGSALVSILTDTSPAGGLPSTWPASLNQVTVVKQLLIVYACVGHVHAYA